MSKALVIVESPAKAKTIQKYLGKGHTVLASKGHIRDLPKSGLQVEVDDGYKPHYEVLEDHKSVVTELRKAILHHASKGTTLSPRTHLAGSAPLVRPRSRHLSYAR